MKQWLLFMSVAMIILACSNAGSDNPSTAVSGQTVASRPDGEKLYKQYCVTCHGLYGDMGASGAFNLRTSQLSLEERALVVTNGRNAMTAFKSLLSPKEIKAVSEFTLKFKEKD